MEWQNTSLLINPNFLTKFTTDIRVYKWGYDDDSKKILTKKIIEKLNQDVLAEIKKSFSFAEKSKFPKKEELHKDIYA